MDEQNQSLQTSLASIEQMMSSLQSLSENFSAQSSKLQNLITKARNGEHEMKNTSSAINKITDDVGRIGKMIGVIDDISQQTNLLSMNAAIEAAHAGTAGRGFAVVASEIKKLAETTASKANEVGSSLNKIVEDTDSTAESSEKTSQLILEMITNILQLTEVMNSLLTEVNQLSAGSNSIMEAIEILKSDNQRVITSSEDINSHVDQLQKNMLELVSISNKGS